MKMSHKNIEIYSVKMSLLMIKKYITAFIPGSYWHGAPDPSGHQILPEIVLKMQVFPPQNYTRGVLPISIGFRGINAYRSGVKFLPTHIKEYTK